MFKIQEKFLGRYSRCDDFFIVGDFNYMGTSHFGDGVNKNFEDELMTKRPNMVSRFRATVFDRSFVNRGYLFTESGEPFLKPKIKKAIENNKIDKEAALWDMSNWSHFAVSMNYLTGKYKLYQGNFAPIILNHNEYSESIGNAVNFSVENDKLMCDMEILTTNKFSESVSGAVYASKIMAGLKLSVSAGCKWNPYTEDMIICGSESDYTGDESDPIKFEVKKFTINELSIVNIPAFKNAVIEKKQKNME